jgi:hypothetical protein
MNYDQFVREERSRYELFAKTVVAILQSAIDAEPRDFRLQQITHRAKDSTSLERKLTEWLRRAFSPAFRAGSLYPLIPWRVGAEEAGAAK